VPAGSLPLPGQAMPLAQDLQRHLAHQLQAAMDAFAPEHTPLMMCWPARPPGHDGAFVWLVEVANIGVVHNWCSAPCHDGVLKFTVACTCT